MKKTKILLVEDQRNIRINMKAILELEEYLVHDSSDGFQALAAVKKYNFDLVISDIKMNTMDGLELVSQIRQISAYMNIPIILVTAKQKNEILEILGNKYIYYLPKPFTYNELIQEVENSLKQIVNSPKTNY